MRNDDHTVQVRKLRVYSKYLNRTIFPEIRLCGKWLQDTGFHDGQKIIVQHEKNKIIIILDHETDA
jgi:toxic protein SymE